MSPDPSEWSPAEPVAAHTSAQSAAGECEPLAALERLGGDQQLYADILARFLTDSAGGLTALRAAVASADAAGAHRAAHALKGLAGMCGALSVARSAAEMESLTKTGWSPQAIPALDRLLAEIAAAATILAPYRHL